MKVVANLAAAVCKGVVVRSRTTTVTISPICVLRGICTIGSGNSPGSLVAFVSPYWKIVPLSKCRDQN